MIQEDHSTGDNYKREEMDLNMNLQKRIICKFGSFYLLPYDDLDWRLLAGPEDQLIDFSELIKKTKKIDMN